MSNDGVWVKVHPDDAGFSGLAWGDFTTNGDEHASDTWGPDDKGRMWKWAEWNVADDYTVNLSGGLYWVLCVGGGSGGINSNHPTDQGQPGLVNEGYWEFSANDTTPIKVGAKGPSNSNSDAGRPSSVGDYGTQGISGWGDVDTGRGSLALFDNIGYKSRIAGGVEKEYATGYKRSGPGRAGYQSDEQTDGCVIIATVTDTTTLREKEAAALEETKQKISNREL